MSLKLTEEEFQEFKKYRSEANRYASILGELHYQKTLIEFELDSVKSDLKENAKKQQEQLVALGKKYGDGSINFETGEITPLEIK